MHLDEIEPADAPSAAIAIDIVNKRLEEDKRLAIRAENIMRRQLAAERVATRARAEAERSARNREMVAAYERALANDDFGTLYDIGSALRGDYFVDYVLASNTKNVSDLYNALDLANDGRRATIQRRLQALTSDYTPSWTGYGLHDDMMDNLERTYRQNLQRWMDGGNPPVPNWTRR